MQGKGQENRRGLTGVLVSCLVPAAIALGAWALTATGTSANPLFARQTGFSCNVCHFQHYPKLNAFGRRFKATGYSLMTQDALTGERLSIPPTFNAALKMGVQYTDKAKTPQDPPGKIEFPPDHGAALLVGGRLAEGMGGYAEYDGSLGSAKLTMTGQLPGELGAAGITPFMTDRAGATFGYDLLNTGSYSMGLPFARAAAPLTGDNAKLGTSGAATGVSLHLFNDNGFIAYTPYAATSPGQYTGLALSQLVRGAITPQLFGWEVALGGGYFAGSTNVWGAASGSAAPGMVMYRTQNESPAETSAVTGGPQVLHTRGWFADAQLQGQVLAHNLGLYAILGQGDEPGADNVLGGVDARPYGLGLSAEYSLLPQLDLLATYGLNDTGDTMDGRYDKWGLGLNYSIQQNILLQPIFEVFTGPGRPLDTRFTTLLSFVY